MPEVSVIIPVHNSERFIGQCLDSIVNQTIEDIEIIVVDDGSTDGSAGIYEAYAAGDSRIKVVKTASVGAGYARNAGLEIASGKYVGFVDSDDYVSQDMFRKLVKEAVHTDADCVRCGYSRIIGSKVMRSEGCESIRRVITGKKCKDYAIGLVGENRFNPDFFKVDTMVWNGIYSTALIQKHGLSFLSEREIMSEDMIFNLDFFSKCRKIVTLPDCLYFYRLNEGSLSRRLSDSEMDEIRSLLDCLKSRARMLDDEKLAADFRLRYERLAIALCVTYMSKAVRYCTTRAEAAEVIRAIVGNSGFRLLISGHPAENLTVNYRVVRTLVKFRLSWIIYLLFRIKNMAM